MINKFPLYTQNEAMDCGPACLRMVAKYYGHHYSLQTLRKKCFITREGVSKYISDSMGHSGGGDITSNYIGAYPLAKMLEYNHYLLNEKPKEATPVVDKKALLEMLKGLSEEKRMELMANLSD